MSTDAALGLARIASVARRDLQSAARAAGGPEALWQMSPARLCRHLRLDGAVRDEVQEVRRSFDAAAEREALAAEGRAFVEMSRFPRRLREIYDPPFGLFVRSTRSGLLDADPEHPFIAIVGARRASAAGNDFARRLAAALAGRDAVIVSGLAHGIDAAAHRGALEGGGATLAVLGCGVDVEYPRANQSLARRIVDAGAMVSEFWPSTPPAPWHFPARNRIVSGLAHATVVVEAGARSGALITADFAAEHGRQVLAVPGAPWSELAVGTNALIRAGAALCESERDVVAELPELAWADPRSAVAPTVSDAATAVLTHLGEVRTLDRLVELTGRPTPEVLRAIGELEMAELAVRVANGRWCARR